MEILWLLLGLVTGTGITLLILYLVHLKSENKTNISESYSDEELEFHVTGFDRDNLTPETDLTEKEIKAFDKEDSKADSVYSGDLNSKPVLFALSEERVAAEGNILEDQIEKKSREYEADIERNQFIEFKKNGGEETIPSLKFTLSREDVIDYLEDKRGELIKAGKEILPKITETEYFDEMHCGDYNFGFMYERDNVVKFILYLDKDEAERITESHTAFKPISSDRDKNWYDLIIDQSFVNKTEVYQILDKSFSFAKSKYYENEKDPNINNQSVSISDANVFDLEFDTAVIEYNVALEKFRQKHKLPFIMTRNRLLHYAKNYLSDDNSDIIIREKRYLPASLNENGRTYALVYEKAYPEGSLNAGKNYASLIVRISDSYATWLGLRHAGIRRARFPKNRNWYIVPVDASFHSAQMVYRVLKHAKKFVMLK